MTIRMTMAAFAFVAATTGEVSAQGTNLGGAVPAGFAAMNFSPPGGFGSGPTAYATMQNPGGVGSGPMIHQEGPVPRFPPNPAFPFAPTRVYRERFLNPDRIGFAVGNPWDFTPNGMMMNPSAAAFLNASTTVTPYSNPMMNGRYYDPYNMSAASSMNSTLSKDRSYDPNAAATLNGMNAPARRVPKATTSQKSSRKKK